VKVKRLSAGPPSGERLVPLLTFEPRRSIIPTNLARAAQGRLTANLSLRRSRVRQLIAQFVDGFLSKLVFEEFGLSRRPKRS
jgi:hypothetical protein